MFSLRLLCILMILFSSGFSYSAIIVKVRGSKALIHLEGDEASVDDLYKALNLYGQAMGVLRITKTKNNKAIAQVVDGIVEPNWILEKTVHPYLSRNTSSSSAPPFTSASPRRNSIGVLGKGFLSLIFKPAPLGGVARSFNSFSGGASLFSNFMLNSNWSISVQAGGQLLNITESNSAGRSSSASNYGLCSGSIVCQTRFLLWELPISLRYHIPSNNPNFQLWVGAGLSVTYWSRELDNKFDVFTLSAFNKLHNDGHISLGVNITPPNWSLYIPISVTYRAHLFLDHIQNILDQKQLVQFSQISINVGIAKPI